MTGLRTTRIVALALVLLVATQALAEQRLARASDDMRRRLATKMTLSFQGLEVGEAVKVIAERSGVNIAVSARVQGNITLYLKDVAGGTVLDIVSEMTGNAYLADGNILRVMTAEDYEKSVGSPFLEDHELAAYAIRYADPQSLVGTLAQLGVPAPGGRVLFDQASARIILWDLPAVRARADSLVPLLDCAPARESSIEMLDSLDGKQLAERLQPLMTPEIGTVQVLGTGDRVRITDRPGQMEAVREIIHNLDVPKRQVLMEVKIIQVSFANRTSVGIDWQAVRDKLGAIPGSVHGAFSVLPKTVNGDVSSGAIMRVGDLETRDFEALVEALETYGTAELVSTPRVVAVDGETAKIHVGSTVPFVTVDTRDSQGTVYTYEKITQVDVGVKLEITPTIHPNDFITMRVHPEVSSVSRYETTASGGMIPVVEQATLETLVSVKSGIFVVLGGLMGNDHRLTRKGVPLLRSVPLLGYLFGSRVDETVRTELVVLIKPTIFDGMQPFVSADTERR